MHVHAKTYIYHSSISHNSQKWKQLKFPTDNWVNKLWYIHAMGYYSATKREESTDTHPTTWIKRENTLC